jgi:hypothetical protein
VLSEWVHFKSESSWNFKRIRLQQNKIIRLTKVSRNLFTFDDANNIETDDNEKGI